LFAAVVVVVCGGGGGGGGGGLAFGGLVTLLVPCMHCMKESTNANGESKFT